MAGSTTTTRALCSKPKPYLQRHWRTEEYGSSIRSVSSVVIIARSFRDRKVVAHFEFLMTSSLVDGVILSVAVLQAERRISCYDSVCNGRSLGPLVRTRALRDDAL